MTDPNARGGAADDAVAAALRAAAKAMCGAYDPSACECGGACELAETPYFRAPAAAAVAAFLRAIAAPGASVAVTSDGGGYVLHVSAVAIIGLAAAVERAGAQEGGG